MPRLPAPEQIYILNLVGFLPALVEVELHTSEWRLGPRVASEPGEGGLRTGANENLSYGTGTKERQDVGAEESNCYCKKL